MGILNHTRGGNSPNLVLERGGEGGQDIILLLEGEGGITATCSTVI